jgi:intracellular multiplication protein IcmE
MMTINEENEFDDDDFDLDDDGFDEFDESSGKSLIDLWKNNPAIKIGSVVVGAVLLIAIFALMGGDEEESTAGPSFVPRGPEVSAPPGSEGSSQAYIDAVVDQNTNRVEEALSTGGSAIPTPIETPDALLSLSPEQRQAQMAADKGEDDPLERWKKLQEERAARQRQLEEERRRQRELLERRRAQAGGGAAGGAAGAYGGAGGAYGAGGINSPEAVAARSEAVNNLASLMSEQMQSILDNQSQAQVNYMKINSKTYLDELKRQKEQAEEEEAEEIRQQEEAEQEPDMATAVPAGEIVYAQLLTEANSDVPGPVLAEIMSGPLRGSRVLGSFQVQKELITLSFNRVVYNEKTYPIDAVAVDPNTTLTAMATDVDHHYFQRVILPAAAAFIEGVSSAVAETGLTTVTIEGDTVTSEQEEANNEQQVNAGIQEAGQELREILDEMANDLEVTVIIASGTPMGLLMTEPVEIPRSEMKKKAFP